MRILKPLTFDCLAAVLLLVTECTVKAQSTGATGGGQAYSNIKPTLTLRFLLCLQGAYPGQSDGTLQQTDRSVPLVGEIRASLFPTRPVASPNVAARL